ncbi:efflux RND transporter permease subunit, partial [Gluconacetobacter asukensis]
VLDQARLQLIGLSSQEASEQIQFLLLGVPVTQVREDVRTVDLVVRSAGPDRLDPAKLGDMTISNRTGQLIPLSQIGHVEIRAEDPILRRRDRIPTITVQSDIDENLQPPQVSAEIDLALASVRAMLPPGYRIEAGGNAEESGKANKALVPIFPVMVLLTLIVLVFETRSISGMFMVFLTAPLGLIGTVPTLLIFHQP